MVSKLVGGSSALFALGLLCNALTPEPRVDYVPMNETAIRVTHLECDLPQTCWTPMLPPQTYKTGFRTDKYGEYIPIISMDNEWCREIIRSSGKPKGVFISKVECVSGGKPERGN